jgi:hypothetical protein
MTMRRKEYAFGSRASTIFLARWKAKRANF